MIGNYQKSHLDEVWAEIKIIEKELFSSHFAWALGCFGLLVIHGILAEDVLVAMKSDGFRLGWFFSFTSALSSFLVSLSHTSPRLFFKCFRNTLTPIHLISGLAFSLSQGLAGVSLLFLHYNTVIVLKSCKIVFVLLVGYLMLGEKLTFKSVVCAFAMAFGLVVLSNADIFSGSSDSEGTGDKTAEVIFGFSLMLLSLIIAAVGNVMQQAVLQNFKLSLGKLNSLLGTGKDVSYSSAKKSKSEIKEDLILHSSFVTCTSLFVVCLFTGELNDGMKFFANHHSPFQLLSKQIAAVLVLTFSQRMLLGLSQIYGATVVQILSTIRKVSSYALSIVLFPKFVSMNHVAGVLIVTVAAFVLQQHLVARKKQKVQRQRRAESIV